MADEATQIDLPPKNERLIVGFTRSLNSLGSEDTGHVPGIGPAASAVTAASLVRGISGGGRQRGVYPRAGLSEDE